MPLPKQLFTAVEDFAKLKGARYTPKQTAAALKELVNKGLTKESKMYRTQDINSLKDTGLLNDPNVERAYAVGSSVTNKEIPTDLDILARGKTGAETSMLQKRYGLYKSDHPAVKSELLHATTPIDVQSEGQYLRFKTKPEMDASSARTANKMAEKGVEKYGQDHKWIRLVALPAAVGLGVMAPGEKDEAEAGFKPLDIARTAAAMIKQNSTRLKNPHVDEMLTSSANKASKYLGEAETAIKTPRRISGVINSMGKIPPKEFNRFEELIIKPRISELYPIQGNSSSGLTTGYEKKWPSKIRMSSSLADSNTFPHEVAHSRQHQDIPLMQYLDELQGHVEKWIKGDWEKYYKNPMEIHARGVEQAVSEQPSGQIAQTLYDKIYEHQLEKAVRYTEKWLKDKDPTFKSRFIKNAAIGGAVTLALQMGPDGDATPADAMPRGVYQKAGEIMGEVSSAAKNLVGKVTDGKVIQNVLKGKGSDRRLIFQDGTESIVKQSDLHDLSMKFGRTKYLEKFAKGDSESKLMQAMKSMQIHITKAENRPFPNADMKRRWADEHLTHLEEMGIKTNPDICFVSRGNYVFTMPKAYAELLEKEGQLEIIKSKKYLDILNKHKVK